MTLLTWLLVPHALAAPYVAPSVTPFVGGVFGGDAPVRVSWGVRASTLVVFEGQLDCRNLSPSVVGAGGSLGFAMAGLHAPRVTMAATGAYGSGNGAPFVDGAVDIGVAVGAKALVSPTISVLGGVGPAVLQVRSTPLFGEPVSVEAGFSVLGIFPSSQCVIGRPARDEDGDRVAARAEVLGPTGLAALWARDAADEGEAIAAFLALAAELAAAGAPRALVDGALRAARDEVLHSAMAAVQAARHGSIGEITLPTPPARAPDLARLAVESYVDGVIGEGAAAAEAAEAARRTGDAHHARIAVDEARHAALGAAVVDWALEAGGERVHHALSAVLAAERPPADDGHLPAAVRDRIGREASGRARRWLRRRLVTPRSSRPCPRSACRPRR
ncbi:MAG: hypothetical protein H6735_01735 [Alphaproteobacteria bacterium]|nr:hypothetical protein [Alphaproteobacteria bacterium]